jgi:hypothetical protein
MDVWMWSRYATTLGLLGGQPTRELRHVLGALGSGNVGDTNACRKLLGLYRTGKLGRFCLDDVPTPTG